MGYRAGFRHYEVWGLTMAQALNGRLSKTISGDLPPLRAIIYARASKDGKGRQVSVSSQVAEGRAFCKRHNIVVVVVLIDNDMSASRYGRKERPEYKEALRVLAMGEANLLWTWENSRAIRMLDTFVELRRLLIDVHGYWAYDDRIYDMDDPDDRIDTAEDAVDSEKESEKLRKRVRRGVKSRALDGEYHGKIWFGHMKSYHDRTGAVTIVPHPEQAPLVVEAVTKLLSGEGSEGGIARDFNDRGIPCPNGDAWMSVHVVKLYGIAQDAGAWAELTSGLTPEQFQSALQVLAWIKDENESPSFIARRLNDGEYPHVFPGKWCNAKVRGVVLNPALAGLRKHQGKIIGKANWDGIITPEQHYQLVAKLSVTEGKPNKDGERIKYLLSGCLLCSQCNEGTRGSEAGYRCPVGHMSRKRTEVDAYVVEAVLCRLERSDAAELFLIEVDEDKEIQEAKAEAKKLRARLDAFTMKAAEGRLSAERLAQLEEKLQPQIDAAEAKARKILVRPVLKEVVGPQAREAWARLNLRQKREVLRAVVRPRLLRVGRGRTTFDSKGIELNWVSYQAHVPELTAA